MYFINELLMSLRTGDETPRLMFDILLKALSEDFNKFFFSGAGEGWRGGEGGPQVF